MFVLLNDKRFKPGYILLTVMCVICLIYQGLFPPGQGSTIGVDFMIKTIDVNKEPVKVCNIAILLSLDTCS